MPFTVSVEGRPVAVNVYGPVPPDAARVAVYGLPTVPFGSGEVVVTVTGAALMVRLSVVGGELTDGVAASWAVTVTLPLKVALGVPVIWLPLTVSVEGRPVAVNV